MHNCTFCDGRICYRDRWDNTGKRRWNGVKRSNSETILMHDKTVNLSTLLKITIESWQLDNGAAAARWVRRAAVMFVTYCIIPPTNWHQCRY